MLDLTQMLDVKQASVKAGITQTRIYSLMKAEKFPKGIKIGSARLWTITEIDEWKQTRNSKRRKGITE